MKLQKMLITMLTLVLLLVAFPICSYAEEGDNNAKMVDDPEMREVVIEKAITAFPEYEKQIKGEVEVNLSNARGIVNDEVVINETRNLSKNEIITYTQYESGIVTTALGYVEGKDVTVLYDGGTYRNYSMDAWMTHSLSSTMLYIQDINFRIYDNLYDKLIDRGSLVSSGAYLGMRENETSAKKALVEYRGWFYYDLSDIGTEVPLTDTRVLKIEIGNNTWTLSSARTSELENE